MTDPKQNTTRSLSSYVNEHMPAQAELECELTDGQTVTIKVRRIPLSELLDIQGFRDAIAEGVKGDGDIEIDTQSSAGVTNLRMVGEVVEKGLVDDQEREAALSLPMPDLVKVFQVVFGFQKLGGQGDSQFRDGAG